jgi:NADH-quinone oxidoreductase subunit K
MNYLHVGLNHFLVLGSVLFALGLYGIIAKNNTFARLLSLQLAAAGINIVIAAFSVYEKSELAGQVLPVFVIITMSLIIVSLCFTALKYYRKNNAEVSEGPDQ